MYIHMNICVHNIYSQELTAKTPTYTYTNTAYMYVLHIHGADSQGASALHFNLAKHTSAYVSIRENTSASVRN